MSFHSVFVIWVMALLGFSGSLLAAELTIDAMCKAAGVLDARQLTKKDLHSYELAMKEQGFYQFFQLAEQISTNKAYKKDKNKLTLQAVCLEGFAAPAEIDGAIEAAYQHWQSGKPFVFDLCAYNTSGTGAGFCADRWIREQDKARDVELSRLAQCASGTDYQLIRETYKLAVCFIELKVNSESLDGGTARVASNIESINAQKNLYIRRIENTLNGLLPDRFPNLKEAEKQMSRAYQKLRERLMIKPITGFNVLIEFPDIRRVQEGWQEYREKTVVLLRKLNNKTTLNQWRALLTSEREEELKYVLEFDENAP